MTAPPASLAPLDIHSRSAEMAISRRVIRATISHAVEVQQREHRAHYLISLSAPVEKRRRRSGSAGARDSRRPS